MKGKIGNWIVWMAAIAMGFGAAAPVQAEGIPVTNKFDIRLYGYIKLDGSYDSQQTFARDLMFYVERDGKKDDFRMTAKETRLGMRLRVPDVARVQVRGLVEMDFYGGGSDMAPNPRLRLAYMDLDRGNWSVRAGHDWDTFISVIPRIINFTYLAGCGQVGFRRPQLRLTNTLPLGEQSKLISKLAATHTIDDGYPSGQANLAFETTAFAGRRLLVGVSGHYGKVKVYDPALPDGLGKFDSWSAIGSLSLPLLEKVTLHGIFWAGENLGAHDGGIRQRVNIAGNTGIRSMGGWGQVVVNITPDINVNVGYGLDHPRWGDVSPDVNNNWNRSKNELIFGNIFYALTPAVTLAAEYTYIQTGYKISDDDREYWVNHRVQCSMIFRF